MQAPNWTDFLQCSICTCKFDQGEVLPISLSCGHSLCTRCLGKLKTRTCPYDKVAIRADMEKFPSNAALLQLLGYKPTPLVDKDNQQVLQLSEADQSFYSRAVLAILEVAMFLQPLAEHGITAAVTYLTKPMLKKLVAVVNCQCLECDGQARAVRAARSIADRMVTELLVMHQNQQQISTLLWTAVRNRGCQFLGPVMQEEALRLILRVLESGNSLSRKNIVLFVVQRLSNDFPQASKTSVGHVVQLLYRASCFNVEKRDDDSSLMQLKEEFRSYECLRREHDGQIIRMAMEAGLRISPEQWSTLLYGDHKHKSDMQSIIDKLISQGAASSGLSELIVAIGRSQDPYQLSEKVVPHLETIFKMPVNPDKTIEKIEWEKFATVMEALLAILHGFSTFMQIQNGRFKTGICPYLSKPGGCPKGERCTYAHSEEERDRFRNLVKPVKLTKPRSGDQFSRNSVGGRRSGDHGPIKAHTDTHTPSLNSFDLLSGSSDGQHFSDLIRYSGEQLHGVRVGGRPVSLTAPVLSSQEWHQVPRGTANLEQNGLAPYLSTEHIYPKPLPSALPPAPTFAVGQPLSNIDLIRLQHEAVKQSVEATTYSRELAGPSVGNVSYRQVEWINTGIPEGQGSLPSTYSQPTSDPYALVTEDLLASGSLQHDSMLNQQVLSGLQRLELSGGPSGYSSGSSYPSGNSDYTSPQPPISVSVPVCLAPPPTNLTTTATPTLITTSSGGSGEGMATSASNIVDTSSQGELQAEIERLKKQLREHQQMIQHQSAQLQYGHGAGGVVQSAPVTPNPQYSTQQVYSNNVGMIIGDETAHIQPVPPPAPIQYNRQIQAAAAAMAAALVSSQANTAQYYPSTAPLAPTAAPTNPYPPQPHRWSGPQAGGGAYAGHAATPNSNYVIQAPYVIPSSNISRQPQLVEHSEDAMLAAYVQILEQNKAAAAAASSTGPTYQTTPTYNPQGHYYYRH